MPHHIFKFDIENWWERKFDEFIQQESELRRKILRVVKSTVVY
jgi:hypothetical protein